MCLVLWRDQRTSFSLPQSSSSGHFTRVMRKETAILISRQVLLQRNRSWATVWWKFSAWVSGRDLALLFSCTEKRRSAAGVAQDVVMGLGNLVSIFDVYLIIDTFAIPSLVKLKSMPR